MIYHVYVLKSQKNGRPYVGFTRKTPKRRLEEHNYGSNQWTRHNGPFDLVYFERFNSRKEALGREKYFKSGSGREFLKSLFPSSSVGRAARCEAIAASGRKSGRKTG